MRRWLRTAGLIAAVALAGCRSGAPPAALRLDRLPKIPAGHGTPYAGQVRLDADERALVLPSGRRCARPDDGGCPEALAALHGQALALALVPEQVMADLSGPLAALSEALGEGGTACLLASDGSGPRCLAMRPFGSAEFSAWLDAPKPVGKVRVVMRADGLEVVTDAGKVPGPDRFGPSLPPIDGRPDFAGLDRLSELLARRFPDEREATLAPSGRTPVDQAVRALALLGGPEQGRFETLNLVYP